MRELIIKQVTSITVERFYKVLKDSLDLHHINNKEGLSRPITQPAINRPGLALAGYFTHYAHERIQIFGNSEMAYLLTMSESDRKERLERIFTHSTVPCLVFPRGVTVPKDIIEMANNEGICIFVTRFPTMVFSNRATMILEQEFSSKTSMHGCMVNVRGVGVMITGKGGIGKSEISLGLVERGASLVADDMVYLRKTAGEISGRAPDLSQGFIEIRGLGIINVTNLFGLRALTREMQLHLVVNLTTQNMNEMERLGLERKTINIMGVEIERIDLPVAAGRDMSRLIEVAALGHYLRGDGYDMAGEFTKRLHQEISRRSKKPEETTPSAQQEEKK